MRLVSAGKPGEKIKKIEKARQEKKIRNPKNLGARDRGIWEGRWCWRNQKWKGGACGPLHRKGKETRGRIDRKLENVRAIVELALGARARKLASLVIGVASRLSSVMPNAFRSRALLPGSTGCFSCRRFSNQPR